MNLSKLTRVKIRDIWKAEDRDFTPWLVENISRLNEDLGFNIQDPQRESKLQNFFVDIVGEDDEGKIIIENQYDKSDHDHLGKLLTYVSNVSGAKKAIWIVEDAKPDHVNTINWLNENIETCSFYLVRIEVFKIEESAPAVNFNMIAGPTEITKVKQKKNKEESDREKSRYQFWSSFLEQLKKESNVYESISPSKYNWLGCSSGFRGVGYNCAIRKFTAQAEVYIDRKDADENKKIFQLLESKKKQIEEIAGNDLLWEELPDSRACRISKKTDIGGWQEDEKWDELAEELSKLIIQVKLAFDNPIKEIQKNFKS